MKDKIFHRHVETPNEMGKRRGMSTDRNIYSKILVLHRYDDDEVLLMIL